MNNQLKKILLLPSLLLANAYLMVGGAEVKTNINLETYSEKVKLPAENEVVSKVVSESKIAVQTNEKSNDFDFIFLSLLSLSLAVFIFNSYTKSNSTVNKKTLTVLVFVKLKLQEYTFCFIKSLRKTFHSTFQKLFFYSFVL